MEKNQTKLKKKIMIFEEKHKELKNSDTSKKINVGLRVSIDLVSTIIVSVLIGLGIDKIFSTHPIFFIIFLLLGFITAFYNIIRYMKRLK